MLTTNVLQRCFLVRCGDITGTCFTIEVDNRQYIVTAYHVVKSFDSYNCSYLDLYNENLSREGPWVRLPVELVGHYIDDVDGVSVFAPKYQVSITYSLPPTQEGIVHYDDVYILGFPEGLKGGIDAESTKDANRGYPLPIVKKGILSAWYIREGMMLLDTYNMHGFSGGPVIMKSRETKDFIVTGIVSGYRTRKAPVYLSIENQQSQKSFAHTLENTGLTIAYSIDHAVKLICQQSIPIGFNLG